MAAVRLEDSVWKNWRFRALGQRCGQNKSWAIGKMAEVYSECTERNSEIVEAEFLEALAAEDGVVGFVDAMIACKLAELVPEGVRIRGCKDEEGNSRIDWLAEKRAGAKRGAEARWGKAQQLRLSIGEQSNVEMPYASHAHASRMPSACPLPLTPSPSLSKKIRIRNGQPDKGLAVGSSQPVDVDEAKKFAEELRARYGVQPTDGQKK